VPPFPPSPIPLASLPRPKRCTGESPSPPFSSLSHSPSNPPFPSHELMVESPARDAAASAAARWK
jgi:hypothetical protein